MANRSRLPGQAGANAGARQRVPLPPLTDELLSAGTEALEEILLELDSGLSPQRAVEIIYEAMARRSFPGTRSNNSCT